VEKILVSFLAVFLFGIGLRFLYAGSSGVLKVSTAVLVAVICLLAFRKSPTK